MGLTEPIRVEREEPAILSNSQVSALLDAAVSFFPLGKKLPEAHKVKTRYPQARPDLAGFLIPYVALGIFAGIRPKELARLTWRDIDLGLGLVTIASKVSKKRERRHIDMSDNLKDWLT